MAAYNANDPQSDGWTPQRAGVEVPLTYAGDVKFVAGAVSDAAYTTAPIDGTFGVDTSNGRLYIRVGGVWKYTALT